MEHAFRRGCRYHNTNEIDAATSENILNGIENIELNLEVADFIKGKQVSSKEALKYMRKRLAHKNPNIQLLSLSVAIIFNFSCLIVVPRIVDNTFLLN